MGTAAVSFLKEDIGWIKCEPEACRYAPGSLSYSSNVFD
ncbi:hypothetical protein HMPREF1152_0045 [Mogibacterium sp. CM50]|uniref:Uncharacterized protein n=1 Tax=Mogibacterium timidum ATCC 33093 TaxID=1401079 RepID=X8IS22_9FIRM|nr:hypothetical protein HMPREF1152_0045 [Mogibacterium sp. CM50]EUC52570.1 hypothetical protein HMPREF0581_1135 [Mogibacterium timidum ATCC 33093]